MTMKVNQERLKAFLENITLQYALERSYADQKKEKNQKKSRKTIKTREW